MASRKKTADLSSGLVAVKGSGAPAPDSIPRDEVEPEATGTPLNFRVPASFRREFKTYAAAHDLKLIELLRLAFEAYLKQQGQ